MSNNPQFQSTHPRRVRPVVRKQKDIIRNFNPRTREGCDGQSARCLLNLTDFNPRTREGCDSKNIQLYFCFSIKFYLFNFFFFFFLLKYPPCFLLKQILTLFSSANPPILSCSLLIRTLKIPEIHRASLPLQFSHVLQHLH